MPFAALASQPGFRNPDDFRNDVSRLKARENAVVILITSACYVGYS
jgi:hypothetical protein